MGFSSLPGSMQGRNLLSWKGLSTILLLTSSTVGAIDLNVNDADSIKAASSQIAFDLMSIYTGNRTGDVPGNLPAPYFWWECGAMFGTMINYWFYTNDTTYNDVTTQAMLHQVGPDNNYMPPNQTSTLGNDDQGFWAMSVMEAAEYNFPNPPSDQPQWLALAQGVFNSQAPRWDQATCGGGLRWQIFPFNTGFDYKNAISNGVNFNLAARLARYTGNQSYADWAEKQWDWLTSTKLVDPATYAVFDGGHIEDNCTSITPLQWTYNVGVMLHGAANMFNYTNGSAIWQERVQGLLNATDTFFSNQGSPNIMVEVACENTNTCDNDQLSFKAYLSRWMAATTVLAPFTSSFVQQKLSASASAAAQQCSGSPTGTKCGQKWFQGAKWDGSTGVGQQMSALEVVQSNMVFILQKEAAMTGASGSSSGEGSVVKGPVTQSSGGTSQGDASAGTKPSTWNGAPPPAPITGADRAGASFLTIFLIGLMASGSFWINTGSEGL